MVCAALDECHEVGACDTGTGTCNDPPKADGSSCGAGGHCESGACVPLATVDAAVDSGTTEEDAGVEASSMDAGRDASVPSDAGHEASTPAGLDAGPPGAGADASARSGDGGSDAREAAGEPTAADAAADSGTTSGAADGCGCRAAGRAEPPPWLILVLAAHAFTSRSRRRRSASPTRSSHLRSR